MIAVQQTAALVALAALPRFVCHKTVQAGKILSISAGDSALVTIEIEVGPTRLVWQATQEWYARHQPQPGGYVVAYADGYTSFSPAKAFEEGYVRIEENAVQQLGEGIAHRAPPGDNSANVVDAEVRPQGGN